MKVFRDYSEVSDRLLEGFTVTKVSTGINAEGSGMMLDAAGQGSIMRTGLRSMKQPITLQWRK